MFRRLAVEHLSLGTSNQISVVGGIISNLPPDSLHAHGFQLITTNVHQILVRRSYSRSSRIFEVAIMQSSSLKRTPFETEMSGISHNKIAKKIQHQRWTKANLGLLIPGFLFKVAQTCFNRTFCTFCKTNGNL